jgi:hypothetical protein
MSDPVWQAPKKRAGQGCVVLHSVFGEQCPPQSGERLAASLVLEFPGRELDRGNPKGRCHRGAAGLNRILPLVATNAQNGTNRKFTTPKLCFRLSQAILLWRLPITSFPD